MAAGPLVVGAEGVILIPDEGPYASSRPIMDGIELVTQLKHFPTSNTTVIVHTQDVEGAAYFVKINGLPETSVTPVLREDMDDAATAQMFAIERLRAKGPIRLVLTAHYEVYEMCRRAYQPVVLYARRGSLGSLGASMSWETLEGRVQRHRDALVEAMDDEAD